jgi:hypothetical protein
MGKLQHFLSSPVAWQPGSSKSSTSESEMGRFAQSRISASGHGEQRQITRAPQRCTHWAARRTLIPRPPAFCVIIAGNHYKRRGVQIKASQQIYTNRALSLLHAQKGLWGAAGSFIFIAAIIAPNPRWMRTRSTTVTPMQMYMFVYKGWCARLIKTLLPAGDVYLSLSAGAAVLSDSCAPSGTRMEWKRRKQTRPNGADNFANEPVVIAALHFYCTGVCLWVCVGAGQIEAPTTLSKKTCSKREFLSVEWY